MIHELTFPSDNLKLFGRFFEAEKSKRCVIFLHGGGHSNCYRFELIQKKLLEAGISSFAFDFRGCGKSEGNFEEGSLKNRIIDAKNAVKFISSKYNFEFNNMILSGGSMGGYIACRIINDFDFEGIVVQAGAAYSFESENVKLNNEFTNLIIKPNSWINSPAFTSLKNFGGRKLVIYGELDDTIPDGIKSKYKEIVGENNFIILKNGKHKLLVPENDLEKKVLDNLAEEIVKFSSSQ